MTRALNLTDEQQAQVRALLESRPTRRPRGTESRERMDELRSRLDQILTPDQRQRLTEAKQRGRRGDRMRGGRGDRRGNRR